MDDASLSTVETSFLLSVVGCEPTNFAYQQIEDLQLDVSSIETITLNVSIDLEPCDQLYQVSHQAIVESKQG